jgi:hypothetical protein
MLLEKDLLNAFRDLVKGRNGLSFGILGKKRVVVVGLNIFRFDADALAEALFNEAENFDAGAEIGFHAFLGQALGRQECLPASIGGAVLADAGGDFLANFGETGFDIGLGWVGGLKVFLANLLLDESTADQLVEGPRAGENTETAAAGVKNRKADFVVDIAGEDGLVVDYRDYAIEDYWGCRWGGLCYCGDRSDDAEA